MLQEFKKFILRGNVIDLAVAVVIGAAFGAIVSSLVNDIIMPVIGYITAGVSFSDLKIVLTPAVMEANEVVKPEVAIAYGNLIQTIIQFLIIGFTIFLVVKAISNMRAKFEKKKEEAVPAAKAADIVLLEEIRDLLKK
ncbi:MAG: large conductance mechanosensitive channel [Clostridiales bacterium]|jgi:large conductance mechanosensitive channel|nr:large conductance mechanosensitive channel [Clostridiales bacterium]